MRPLAEYKRKRNFKVTSEPGAKVAKASAKKLIFVVQEHHASHLHYDFRLEWKGVLKSWAVPKGPSLDPAEKRLAVEVEDHPKDYAKFEGTIPADEYGGGEVFLWDEGIWAPDGDVEAGLKKGHLEFALKGNKLNGKFRLIRTKREASKPNWLLMKRNDEFAETGAKLEPIKAYARSNAGPKKKAETAKRADASKRAKTPANAAAIAKIDAMLSKSKKKAQKKRARAEESQHKVNAEDDFSDFIPPQLAQLVNKPPQGKDWISEVKYDGYRIQAHINGGKVKIFTRNGHDWTAKYPELAKELSRLKVDSAILDGEIVWQDEHGRSDFQKLQNAMKKGTSDELLYWLFDLMQVDGEDLKSLPLIARKTRLEKLVRALDSEKILYSEHYRGVGDQMIEASCQMHLEGIICKRVDRPYTPGRSEDWVKVKCIRRQEFVIGGYTEPEGSRVAFGALLLGYYEGEQLRFVGRCGTGFDQALLTDIYRKLKKLERSSPSFHLNAPKGRGLHWVKPQLVCEVSYAEITADGHLRVPVFKGLRTDKPARQITMEKEKKVKGGVVTAKASAPVKVKAKTKAIAKKSVKARPSKARKTKAKAGDPHISSPERIVFEKEKLTKLDVARYYQAVAEWIVPHIADRPLSLVRCPESSTKPCFYSKHFPKAVPEHVIAIPEKGSQAWFTVDSPEGLLALIQWGTLEIHPWNCHRQKIEKPDQIVMDFDPDEEVDFDVVKEGAIEMREMLASLGLKSYLKATGGKGLHVQFPFEPRHDWDTIKNFAKTLTQEFVSRHPDLYIGNMSKKLRKGKIFLDYLRNGRGATAVAAYSLRAKPYSSVAMPIEWKDLAKLEAANIFTLPKALAHLQKRKSDPWKDYFRIKQRINLLG